MKTLSVGILGIFALGLALGSFVSGSGAVPELDAPELETGSSTAALVNDVECGVGREALLEPVDVNGTTSFKVRCIDTAPAKPAPVVAAPTPVVASAPPVELAPQPHVNTTVTDDTDARDNRTWKESAVVVGGAAGAGAGIGAAAKGKKGALVGAAIGAASGAAYELIKRDKN